MKIWQLCTSPQSPGDFKSYELCEQLLMPNPLARTAQVLMDSIREELLDRHLDAIHDGLDDLPNIPLGEEPDYPDAPPRVWPQNENGDYYLESDSNMTIYWVMVQELK